jgi:ribokinase
MIGDAADVVVTGYASLDVALHATRLATGAQTALLTGAVNPPARDGGCGPNVARILARLGVPTALLSWVGDDADGIAYRDRLVADGVDVRGVESGPGPSPRSILVYDPTGEAACYFHPAGSRHQRLSSAAMDLVRRAAWIVVTVGPPELTAEVLDAARPDARIAWGLKADPVSFTPELCRRLAPADLICLNRAELAFVEAQLRIDAGSGIDALRQSGAGWVAVTRGAAGWTLHGEATVSGTAEGVDVGDPTGAGDAFFAGLIAARVTGRAPDEAGGFAASVAARVLRGELAAGEVGA